MLLPIIFCTDFTEGEDEVSVTVVMRKLLVFVLSLGDEVLRMWIDRTPRLRGNGEAPLIGETLKGDPTFPGEMRKLRASGSMSSIACIAGEKGVMTLVGSTSPFDRGVAMCAGIKFKSSARNGEQPKAPEKLGACCCMSHDALVKRGVIVGLMWGMGCGVAPP